MANDSKQNKNGSQVKGPSKNSARGKGNTPHSTKRSAPSTGTATKQTKKQNTAPTPAISSMTGIFAPTGSQSKGKTTQKSKTAQKGKTTQKSNALQKSKTTLKSRVVQKNESISRERQNAKAKSILVRVIVAVFIATVIGYVGYQIYFWFFARTETVTAMSVTVSETIDTSGTAVRDETVITTTKTGVIVSAVENGAKVYKGQTVANIFPSEAAATAYHRIIEIDEALAQFDSMSTAAADSAAGIDSIEKQLSERLTRFTEYTYSGDLEGARKLGDDILYLLNKGQVATKVETDGFSARIDELRAEKAELEAQYGQEPDTLTSPMSGYYISSIDGYENILNTAVLEGLTPEKLDGIMAAYHEPDDSMVVGKIANDYKWDIVCEVSDEDAARLELDRNYKIYLPYSETESITAKLSTITPGIDSKRVLLTFLCTYMVSDLSVFRSQPIIIELSSFTGLQVSESYIAYEKAKVDVTTSSGDVVEEEQDVPGVYVLWGNEVKFRRIEILYFHDGKAICTEGNGTGWLKRYDEIVTKTKGLYDGKIVLGAS